MSKVHHWILIAALSSVAGFATAGSETEPTMARQAVRDYPEGSWRTRYLELGRETYEWACASCHDEGEDDAPIKGDRESWSDRSPLWSAVLLEHAKNGYLDMPTKGGEEHLSDRAVEAASEYMLYETFPELPRD